MPVATSDDTAPEGYTTVHGYYRFTDIFYEWYACDSQSWLASELAERFDDKC